MNELDGQKNPQETIDIIAALMKERRHNPSSFALALGKSRQWGYAFLKNQIRLSLPLLIDIAKILGVSPDYLLPGRTNEVKENLEKYIRKICIEEIERRAQ